VPVSTEFDVIEFPGYWLVCPTRHMARRPVKEFADWIHQVGVRDTETIKIWLRERGFNIRFEHRAGLGSADAGQVGN
jgi:LysR family transcriptional regulator, glycine cleavage system transcriptional activator